MKFKGVPCITLENETVRATFLPNYGGKLASFYDKIASYEWLFQHSGEKLEVPSYGADFSQYDSSGFDEVFPGIDAGLHPLNGKMIPDHGEVWSLPWKVDHNEEHVLKLSIESPVFQYRIEKRVELHEMGLHFSYRAYNLEEQDFAFIWTPHALLNMNDFTRMKVPRGMTQVMSVEHSSKHLGEWGTIHSFPETRSLQDGRILNLSQFEPVESKNCEKFYFLSKLTEGWCSAVQGDIGRELRYDFPVDKVPYLGVWKTQGGYRGDYNFALEPCTGVYDDVYVGEKIRKVSHIPANGVYEWTFDMKVRSIDK